MVICPDCGKEVPEAKFCKNCGAYIQNIKEVPEIVEEVKTVSEEVVPKAEQTESISENSSGLESDVIVIPEESGEVKEEEGDSIQVNIKTENSNKIKFCSGCGFKLDGEFKFCPNCGCDLLHPASSSTANVVNTTGEKNIIIAIILSVFLPGIGQIYLGLDHKGAIFLIAYIVSAILILLLIGFILCPIIWIWALVDTIISANALNRGEDVKDKLL